jgi:hypothetical protein
MLFCLELSFFLAMLFCLYIRVHVYVRWTSFVCSAMKACLKAQIRWLSCCYSSPISPNPPSPTRHKIHLIFSLHSTEYCDCYFLAQIIPQLIFFTAICSVFILRTYCFFNSALYGSSPLSCYTVCIYCTLTLRRGEGWGGEPERRLEGQ